MTAKGEIEDVLSSNLFQYSPAFSIYYSSAPYLGAAWDPGQEVIAVRLEHSGHVIHLTLDPIEGVMTDKWGIVGWMYFPAEDAGPDLGYAFVIWNR